MFHAFRCESGGGDIASAARLARQRGQGGKSLSRRDFDDWFQVTADRGMLLPPGLRYMVAGAFFFSLMSLLVKLAGQNLPSQQIVLARSLVMAVLAWVTLRRRRIRVLGQRRPLLLLRGVLGFGALSCFYYALVHLPLADATVLQYTNPAFAAVLAIFALGERMRRREVLSVALSLTGVLLVARPAFLFGTASVLDPVAVAIGLLGAVLSAAAYVVVRMLGSEHYMVVIFYFAMVSIIGSTPAAALQWVPPTPADLMLLLGVGVMTHAGQIYMTRGLHLERAGRATAAGLVQIVFAATWGLLVFGDAPDIRGAAGAALVIAGVLLLGRS
ncbi:pseudopaline transport inner membrane protein CntI [soil metagenome]